MPKLGTKMHQNRILSCVFLLAVAFGQCADAGSYYLRKGGNDQNSGGSRDQAFKTLKHAMSILRSGDQLYIGAGEYVADVNGNGGADRRLSKTGLIGDVTGSYTGDKGEVVFRTPKDDWALSLTNYHDLYIHGITFAANPQEGDLHYGLHVSNSTGYVHLNECKFQNLYRGVYANSELPIHAVRCSFSDVRFGIETHNSTWTYSYFSDFSQCQYPVRIFGADSGHVMGCNFDLCQHGLRAYDSESLIVDSCRFRGLSDDSGPFPYYTGMYVSRTPATVQGCTFDRMNTGVSVNSEEKLSISQTTINQPKSWGVAATASGIEISDLEIVGAEDEDGRKQGYGVSLNDSEGNTAVLSGVKATDLLYGVRLYSPAKFRNVVIDECYHGYFHDQYYHNDSKLVLSGNNLPSLSNCYVGIYVYGRPDYEIDFEAKDLELSSHYYGLLSRYASGSISQSSFHGNTHGAYCYQAKNLEVEKCDFSENQHATSVNSGIGLYVQSDKISVESSSFDKNANGLRLYNTNDGSATVRELEITDNNYDGMYVHSGELVLNDSQNVVSKGNRFGIRTYAVQFDLANIDFGDTNDYAFYSDYGGGVIKDCKTSGGVYGFRIARADDVSLSNVTATNATSWGVAVTYSKLVSLDKVVCDSNQNGCYVHTDEKADLEIKDSVFSRNGSDGLYLYGVGLPDSRDLNVRITDNNRGLRVANHPLKLSNATGLQITGNRYGVLSYHSELELSDFDLADNYVGVYVYNSSLGVNNCNIAGEYSAFHCYPFADQTIQVRESKVSGGIAHGVYIYARENSEQHVVSDVLAVDCGSTGVQMAAPVDTSDVPTLLVSNYTADRTRYGVYVRDSYAVVRNAVLNDCTDGVYQARSKASYSDVVVNNAASWGILTYGSSVDLERCRVSNSGYGIHLGVEKANVTNSLVSGCRYGLQTGHAEGVYTINQCTFAGISYYGILHREGQTSLQNCVFDANLNGLYNLYGRGSLMFDRIVVSPRGVPIRGDVIGTNEIVKDPVFRAPQAGDYRLASGSPAINAGKDLSAWISFDIDGNRRPSFDQFEIGAYEYTEKSGSLRVLDWDETAQ